MLVIQLHLPEYDSKQGRDEAMNISTASDAAESCHSEDRGQSVSVPQTESCSADCGSSYRRARLSKSDAALCRRSRLIGRCAVAKCDFGQTAPNGAVSSQRSINNIVDFGLISAEFQTLLPLADV